MQITSYTGGMVQTNGYLVEVGGGKVLFDAPAGVAGWLEEKGVELDALVLTHQHYDHVEDVAELQASGVRVYGWAGYSKVLTLEELGEGYGLPAVEPYVVDELLKEGEREFLGERIEVMYVPGHSADSLAVYFKGAGVVVAGDALFAGSVGRCDLPGGSFELLISGIKEKLMVLPDETRVLPGHGGETTIGRERVSNGYLMQGG